MFTNTLRKSLSLLVLYAVIIIGIFIFQFKNDSIISEKIGSFHITLQKSEASNGLNALKNDFTAAYNGISFLCSDENPVSARIGEEDTPLVLTAWKKTDALSCNFTFSEGVCLDFAVSDESEQAQLSIKATLPPQVSSIYIPYALGTDSEITQQSASRMQITSRKNFWNFTAPEIATDKIVLTAKKDSAAYTYFDKTRAFSFSLVADAEGAAENAYTDALAGLRKNLTASFARSVTEPSVITEQDAVSYVAAMAEKGRMRDALNTVPPSVKNAASRTYLSVPYFDSMSRLNAHLQRQMKEFDARIRRALETQDLDVFTMNFIADYLYIYPTERARRLLTDTASADLTDVSVAQAAGIIEAYAELAEKNGELATLLLPAAEQCAEAIERSCAFDDGIMTISEQGTFLSVIQAVQAGDAILRLGQHLSNPEYVAAGRLIISSYLKDCTVFDLHTLSALYPITVHHNFYYPHFELLRAAGGKPVWAWTCARNIQYRTDENGTITLALDFPVSHTHYVIVSGIPQFRSIYIYDVAFRSDPHFENYNSSGYAYAPESEALLIKSRHRAKIENVELFYKELSKKAETIEETELQSSSPASPPAPAGEDAQALPKTPAEPNEGV